MFRMGSARVKRGSAFGIGLLLASLALVPSCGGAGSEHQLSLEVQDGWVREPGEECAGSRPYLYIHRDGDYRIVDESGEVVVSGSLPAGRAVDAYNEDLGSTRVPTFCRFELSVRLPDDGTYRLILDEGGPVEFSVMEERADPILMTIP